MSRIISAVLLAVFLLAICLFSVSMTEHITNDLSDDFNAVYSRNADKIDDIKTKWSRYSEYASVYLDHEELEELSLIIASLNDAKDVGRECLALNCAQALEILDHIAKSEKAHFSNIF